MATLKTAAPARPAAGVRLSGLGRLAGLSGPVQLRLMLAAVAAASVLWGAAAAWTAGQHASAAGNVVTASEPLSYDAQQIYQSLSDADATEAAAFLAGIEPPAARQRYLADIARAASYLEAATAAAGRQGQGGARLTVLSTELPIYTGLVESARADNRQGLPVGAAYLAEASELMRSRLLPAADGLYRQENAQLGAVYGQATGLPVAGIIGALIAAAVLIGVQGWLAKLTRRVFNHGLVIASAAGLVSLAWLLVVLSVAGSQFGDARDHGSAPVQALARADIAALRAHADESLTLIHRSGQDAYQADFVAVQKQLGPGRGTLLTAAVTAARGSPAARAAAGAAAAAPAWYAVDQRVRALDDGGNYEAAVQLAIGTGPSSSGSLFRRVQARLTAGINADQAEFASAARGGQDALAGLEAGMIVAALVMVAGCAWGLTRRLAEYG
jgi:hypothetical protein